MAQTLVKTFFLILLVAALGFFGYKQYSVQQAEKLEQQQALERYERDKLAFEAARDSKNPKILFRFIHENPDSAWKDTAQYHLEKQLVEDAVKAQNGQALKSFIKNYPKSEWTRNAKRQLQYLQRIERQRVQQQQQADEVPVLNQRAAQKSPAKPLAKQQRVSSSKKATPRNDDARERVNRALSIYSKVNKQKSKQAEQQKLKREEQEKVARLCVEMKDQLKQFRSNIRWYELDDQGNRVYMDKETVKRQKQNLQDNVEQYCQ